VAVPVGFRRKILKNWLSVSISRQKDISRKPDHFVEKKCFGLKSNWLNAPITGKVLKAANSGGARYKRKHCKNAETVVMREK
jgi:hypothetical protein